MPLTDTLLRGISALEPIPGGVQAYLGTLFGGKWEEAAENPGLILHSAVVIARASTCRGNSVINLGSGIDWPRKTGIYGQGAISDGSGGSEAHHTK